MVAAIPFARVVMVLVIVVAFVAACQGEYRQADEEGQAKEILYFFFHDEAFGMTRQKTLPMANPLKNGGLAAGGWSRSVEKIPPKWYCRVEPRGVILGYRC